MSFPNVSSENKVLGQVSGQVGGQAIRLTERQKEIYGCIVKDPTISRSILSERIGINESAIQKHLETLKKKGLIKRDGETTGRWIVRKE